MRRKLRCWSAGAAVTLAAIIPNSAGAPLGTGFNYQGQLKQAGLPVNGTCDFQFSLWDDPVAPGLTHQLGATQTIVGAPVERGLFSVELNGGGAFGGNAFNGDARWLQLSVRCPSGNGSYTPFAARQKVGPVPYALKVAGIDGHSLDAADGSPTDVVYVNNDGNVGVGTTAPAHKLDLHGDLKGNGRVGLGSDSTIGPAGGYDTIFDFSHTITDFSTANNWSPFRSYITLDPNASLNFPSAIYGHDLETTIARGNTQDFDYVQGPYLGAFHRGDGDVDTLNGTTLGAQHFGPGTINFQVGAYVYSGASGLGTITNNYGLGIDCGHENPAGTIQNNYAIFIGSPLPHAVGPLQNHYGIYLKDQDFGQVDSYAIYSAGGKSYFQDQVGIGTANPQAMLHIGGTPGVDGIRFPDGTLQTTAAIGGSGDSVWSLNGGSAYYNAGKVGIGTASPGMSLEVSTPSYYGFPALGASHGNAYAYLHVNSSFDHSLVWDNGRAMRFGTETARESGYVEHMRITQGGNVGIGTLSPTARLHAYEPARSGSGGVAVYGLAAPTSINFGFVFHGGIGVKGESRSNIGVLGTSTESYGVKGESQNNDGVHGLSHHAARSGVWGNNDAGGYGIAGSSPNGGFAGVYGNGSRNGVFGSTASASDSGVHGRNDSSGWGLNGYAAGALVGEGRFGGTGVEGISDGLGGYGVIGRAHGLNGIGVHAEAQNGSALALWAYNPGGRAGLFDGSVDVNGPVEVNVLTIAGGSDLAEPFDIASPRDDDGTIEPGRVVVIDPQQPGRLKLATEAYDRKVAGIVSGANSLSPGMILKSSGDPYADGEHPVALTGRVWCTCDASNNAIQPGDLLTTSDRAGHAMKAVDLVRAQGAIIGKAMTPLPQGELGLVLVLVNLQ